MRQRPSQTIGTKEKEWWRGSSSLYHQKLGLLFTELFSIDNGTGCEGVSGWMAEWVSLWACWDCRWQGEHMYFCAPCVFWGGFLLHRSEGHSFINLTLLYLVNGDLMCLVQPSGHEPCSVIFYSQGDFFKKWNGPLVSNFHGWLHVRCAFLKKPSFIHSDFHRPLKWVMSQAMAGRRSFLLSAFCLCIMFDVQMWDS